MKPCPMMLLMLIAAPWNAGGLLLQRKQRKRAPMRRAGIVSGCWAGDGTRFPPAAPRFSFPFLLFPNRLPPISPYTCLPPCPIAVLLLSPSSSIAAQVNVFAIATTWRFNEARDEWDLMPK
jgi:hypothetical protein